MFLACSSQVFHGLSLSTQALDPLSRRSLSSSSLTLSDPQQHRQHHRPHHRQHHHHHHHYAHHQPAHQAADHTTYSEASQVSKEKETKDTKRSKKAPNRILRSPVTYAYVRGISGLPTQRIPRHRLAPNPSAGYCRGPVAGTSPGLSRHAYNS